MKSPLTTENLKETCKTDWDDIESYTCSFPCKNCGSRIWFFGSWSDSDIPYSFKCPYCNVDQKNPINKKR